MSYTILKPVVNEVSIVPNPVNQNTAFVIAIVVSETEVELEPITLYAGTFYCGEDDDI